MRQLLLFSLALTSMFFLFESCDTDADTFEATGDSSYFAPSGSSVIQYQVDSVIFDPSVSGTNRIATTSTWTLNPIADTTESKSFFVSVVGSDSASTPVQRYIWDFQSIGAQGGSHVNQLDGISYVSLVTPFTQQSTWDALQSSDPNLVITIEGEPLEIHKDWTTAVIDSIGPYNLPDGTSVDAVYVALSSAENAIELREFTEVYGKGLGLLERKQRMLDTQQASSTEPWEVKAENGFTVTMKRLF